MQLITCSLVALATAQKVQSVRFCTVNHEPCPIDEEVSDNARDYAQEGYSSALLPRLVSASVAENPQDERGLNGLFFSPFASQKASNQN